MDDNISAWPEGNWAVAIHDEDDDGRHRLAEFALSYGREGRGGVRVDFGDEGFLVAFDEFLGAFPMELLEDVYRAVPRHLRRKWSRA